ncbi:hypothetical protein CKO15_13600 [Halorhodospira abdelmalekii]|uniref:TonB-dependent receptor plug domain-containing protein n=1 Tax=Halorhodospira abdelmalekii TaxID=421629 RepID=UPI0019050835|nr:TonB-dependent receptor [Halorhodospira abdelmalekii]MBK1736275.1 hypothetical protein [Halorhodospira abdelmalekii]
MLGGTTETQFTLFGQINSRDAYTRTERAEVRVPAGGGGGGGGSSGSGSGSGSGGGSGGGGRVAPSEGLDWATNGNPVALQNTYAIDEYRRDEADVYTLGGSLEHWFSDLLSVQVAANYMKEERQRDYINSGRSNTASSTNDGGHRPAFNIPVSWIDDNQRWELAAGVDWQATDTLAVSYSSHYSRYEKDRRVPAIYYRDLGFAARSDSDFQGRDITLTEWTHELLNTWMPASGHTVQVGFEHRDHDYRDHVAGQEGSSRWQAGLFAQHEWQVTQQFDLIYGARYDDASIGTDNTSIEGGVVYALTPQASLRANYAQGFKYPEPRSLTADTQSPRGDWMLGADVVRPGIKEERHALQPEQSENFEVGIRGWVNTPQAMQLRYDVSAFFSEIDERIERVQETPEYRTFRNIGTSRTRGVEAALETDWSPRFGTDLTATWLEEATWRRVTQEDYEYLPFAPEFAAIVTLRWQPQQSLHLQGRARYVGEHYTAPNDNEQDERYTVIDVNANYRPPQWPATRFYAALDNVLDTGNETSLYADPGRFARLGMEYQF